MSRTTTKVLIAQEDGTVVGQYFLGDGEHLIGREGHCTIQLEANQVSREHARLIISAEAIEIEDLNSTSGTYLDGVTVKGRIPIQPGQKLWISNLYIDIERQGFGGLIEGSRLGDGRFTLQRELGKGGMGAVWLALDEEVQEEVALKLVSGEISMDSKGLKDLQREVNKSHKLVHPNIVRMGYFWKEEGEPAFISLEYVDGTDLHKIRSDSTHGLLAWEEVQSYMIELCDALEYAHSQKVAHRDIKPSNFMINSEGNLKLADFGIAASLANTSSTFTSNTVLGSGTPPYMSPQQLDGERPQVTDDIYSVGATLYDLLTSKPPFHQGDISYQVRHTEVTPMGERLEKLELANDIPEYVGAIVMACLKKDPAQRPQSMRVIREWITSGKEVGQAERVAPVTVRQTQTLKETPAHATEKAPAGGSIKKWAFGIAAAFVVVAFGYWYGMPKEEGLGGGGNGDPKEPEFLKQGLVAYYPFNGNAKDESGNGNDGKEVNGPALVKDRFGVANSAYSFDGKDDRIETPQKGFPKGESERTTSIWFRLPAKGNKFGVLWGAGAAAPQKLVAIQIRQGIDGPAVLCTDSYAKSIMIKKATLNDSVWHNVIWVLTKGNAKTYLDGEVVEVRPFPVNTNNYYFSNIGGSHVSDQTLLGEIDDVRIYNRALSEAEVKELYEFEKPKTQQASMATPPTVVTPTSVKPKPTPAPVKPKPSTPRQITLEEKQVVGTYERKVGSNTDKYVFLGNGIVEYYALGHKIKDYKWSVVNKEVHIVWSDTTVNIHKINLDNSITIIANIINGIRKGRLKETEATWKKLK